MTGILTALVGMHDYLLCRASFPYRISSAPRTKSFVILGFIDQPITRLENRSTITAKYNQPSCVLIYVISVTHD